MSFTVPEKYRIKSGPMGSNESFGNNGAFWVKTKKCVFTVIASDQMGWEHVSVSSNLFSGVGMIALSSITQAKKIT